MKIDISEFVITPKEKAREQLTTFQMARNALLHKRMLLLIELQGHIEGRHDQYCQSGLTMENLLEPNQLDDIIARALNRAVVMQKKIALLNRSIDRIKKKYDFEP